MKKRTKRIIAIAAVLVVVAVLLWTGVLWFVSWNPFAGQAEIHNGSKTVTVSDEDSKTLRDILYGKGLVYDSPSCGFDEDICITFGWDKFMPACEDACGIVKNHGKYLNLSDAENFTLRKTLNRYGVSLKMPEE